MPEKDYLTIDDFDVSGKTVLARIDINSPMSGDTIFDDKRLRSHSTTVRDLVEGKAKVALMSHQSRPGKNDFTTMQPHAKRLSKILDQEVKYVDDIFGSCAINAIKQMERGDIILLENVRFFSEELLNRPPEEHAQSLMVQRLAPHLDLFVSDAFGAAHRSQLSLVGFTPVLPSCAGRIMEKELNALHKALHGEKPCIYVLGGAKVEDSLTITERVLRENSADKVLVSGVVANVLLAAKGHSLGKKTMQTIEKMGYTNQIPRAKEILEKHGDRIVLPVDVAMCKDNERVEVDVDNCTDEYPINDIGLETIVKYSEEIKSAETVVMNGPAGVFEEEKFALGTEETLKAAAQSKYAVIGGGHITAALERLGLEHKMGHVSTGGGACTEYLTTGKLPAIEALKTKGKTYHQNER